MKIKLIILLGVILGVFSACQQQSQSTLHSLYLSNLSIERSIRMLSGQQRAFLRGFDIAVKASLNREIKRKEFSRWKYLILDTEQKLHALDSLQMKCLQMVGISQKNASFPVFFVNDGHKKIDFSSLASEIKTIKSYADSLQKMYPKLTKGLPNTRVFQQLSKNEYAISWTLFYSEVNQWMHALLKDTEKIVEHHTKHAFLPPGVYNSTGVYLRVVAESETVLEGEVYRAKMMLSDLLDNRAQARIQVNGQNIPVIGGQGIIRLHPKKPGLHEWTGTLTFKSKGRDTTFAIKKKYWVLPK